MDGRGAAAGYRVRDWRLVIVDGEAEIVRTIFRRYAELGSVPVVEGGGRGPRDQKQVVDERFGSPHPASGSGRFYSVLSPPFGNRAQLSQHRNGPTKPVLTGRHGVPDDAIATTISTDHRLGARANNRSGHQNRDRYPKASDISSPPCLLRLLPAGAVAGRGLYPLEKRRLVTAHVDSGPSQGPAGSTRLHRFLAAQYPRLPVTTCL